jgi:hypothetical protein
LRQFCAVVELAASASVLSRVWILVMRMLSARLRTRE